MLLLNNIGIIILLLGVITIISIIVVMLLENRDPIKSLSWILVLLFLPVLGIILYAFFGKNLRRQKIIKRKELKNYEVLERVVKVYRRALTSKELVMDDAIKEKKSIINLQLNNSSSIIHKGNDLKLLVNGKNKFDELKKDLLNAKQFIHLQYYIFDGDNIGTEIKDILIQKAQEGLEVRVLIDDVGSWGLSKQFIRSMRDGGVDVQSFMSVLFPSLTSKVNYRNHRKIVVIDGTVGYLGGINVADKYIHGMPGIGSWRDTHLKIEGNAVNSLQFSFLSDWYFVTQQELSDPKYFHIAEQPKGDKIVQISTSGPDTDWQGIMQGILKIISTAKDYVYLTTPYLMPTESVLTTLKVAAMSNVDVRIIIPEKSDVTITKWASDSYLADLMRSGVKIYFYTKGFIHSKVVVSDDIISSVGSTNIDFRSFEQNFEVTAFVYDKDFAVEVKDLFMDDFKNSKLLNIKEWEQRSLFQKIKESVSRLFSPLL